MSFKVKMKHHNPSPSFSYWFVLSSRNKRVWRTRAIFNEPLIAIKYAEDIVDEGLTIKILTAKQYQYFLESLKANQWVVN